ncbi:MAG: aspartate/glutamate racemase family protein [Candidatus Acetothermia bacterium]
MSNLIGVLRVLTLENQEQISAHGRIIEKHFPNLETVSRCIDGQPNGIYDEQSRARAVPKVTDLAREMAEQKDLAGILISCADDPGVRELKSSLTLPVIGAGESLGAVAGVLGNSVGVLGITEGVPGPLQQGLDGKIKGTARVSESTHGLSQSSTRQNSKQRAQELLDQGCDTLALACTGFSTVGLAREISNEVPVPVIDPVVASGSMFTNLFQKEV